MQKSICIILTIKRTIFSFYACSSLADASKLLSFIIFVIHVSQHELDGITRKRMSEIFLFHTWADLSLVCVVGKKCCHFFFLLRNVSRSNEKKITNLDIWENLYETYETFSNFHSSQVREQCSNAFLINIMFLNRRMLYDG